jgi:hypothetical protein
MEAAVADSQFAGARGTRKIIATAYDWLNAAPEEMNSSKRAAAFERARETHKIVSPDEFVEVFELAAPQKDFELYSDSRWKRVNKQ